MEQDDFSLIPVGKNHFSKISPEDLKEISKVAWKPMTSSSGRDIYAVAFTWLGNGKVETIYLHRMVLGLKKGNHLIVDHLNRDTLDNRRSNLRIASRRDNSLNSRIRSDNRSGMTGVSREKKKWKAQACINGKFHRIGVFSTPQLAHNAYISFLRDHNL